MRCNYTDLVKLRRSKHISSVKVQPTGTAVSGYQIPLGTRASPLDVGVVDAPAWSAEQTETWARIERLSEVCPRQLTIYEGGKKNIDRMFEFGDDFNGTALDSTKWTFSGPVSVANGIVTLGSASNNGSAIYSIPVFGGGYAFEGVGYYDLTTQSTHGIGFYGSMMFQYWNNTSVSRFGFPSDYVSLGSLYTGSYHRISIQKVTDTYSKLYLDSVYLANKTISDSAKRFIYVTAYDANRYAKMKWCAIRKYTSSEPLTGTAQPSPASRCMSHALSLANGIRACCV